MAELCDIGMIGLAVMGENLALNMESHGYRVAVFNRTTSVVDRFMQGRGKGKKFVGCHTVQELVQSLAKPRKVMMLIKAGPAVDSVIDELVPLLSPGDVIIDGGNTYYVDTERRTAYVESKGLLYIGTGVSGGEEGALLGPSMMPGGSPAAWPLVKPIFQSIAAKVGPNNDIPCCEWVGPRGAGHYVKMVHNGIEYGDMQLIAEAYDLLRKALGLSASEIAAIFDEWNRGKLESYLIEITSQILVVNDPETGKPLVDMILDKAGQKGTGKWTLQIALDLAVPIPTIGAALDARVLSSMKDERVAAAKKLNAPSSKYSGDKKELINAVQDALYASKVCSYAQGMSLI
ncbi:MAG TPA: NADP-dependent phosphogluconate dehydrogenase, partial [Pirellulales bacterium]